jgi:hypothetical protein
MIGQSARFMVFIALLAALAARAAAEPLKIRVDRTRHGFVDAAGKPFVPFGVNYYRPGTGWAPQLWKQFDPAATRRDFALLKKYGANVVRVFISYGSFLSAPDKLDPAGLAKFDQLLDLADEAGLYVHPTGPDAWEGMPPWARGINPAANLADERYLKALDVFWSGFAARYRGRSTIWAYDLRNEPAVGWDTPFLRERWADWRKAQQRPELPIPEAKAKLPSPDLADYQHFRESIAETWVARQARAIRAADPEALVTVGLIQWSVPAQRIAVSQYSGFRPAAIARHLDFMELHYYPLAAGTYHYDSLDAETANRAAVEAMAREAAKPGLPLVIAEFGWYGGGPLEKNGAPATEGQQAQWCRRLVEVTSTTACGWLNWGMYDHPQARDVSRLTGLFTVDGKEKAWGREFKTLANRFKSAPPHYAPPPARPDLPWEECIASGEAMERFRKAYPEAFRKPAKLMSPG